MPLLIVQQTAPKKARGNDDSKGGKLQNLPGHFEFGEPNQGIGIWLYPGHAVHLIYINAPQEP
jgi:hypothetical protein